MKFRLTHVEPTKAIQTIKAVRALSGLGLKEAKDVVDSVRFGPGVTVSDLIEARAPDAHTDLPVPDYRQMRTPADVQAAWDRQTAGTTSTIAVETPPEDAADSAAILALRLTKLTSDIRSGDLSHTTVRAIHAAIFGDHPSDPVVAKAYVLLTQAGSGA